MIERVTVNGRPALAAYLNDKLELVDDQKSATLVKLTFTDDEGGAVFLKPSQPEE